jgi:NAD(P)-dependent dehydrogenase (short-subunit alcohol dehydrogenase family)
MLPAGHFYLTKLLLPVLTETAESAPAKSVRVVNVSSVCHYLGAAEGIRWSTLAPGKVSREERTKLGGVRLFGQSKLVKSTSPLDTTRTSCITGEYSLF